MAATLSRSWFHTNVADEDLFTTYLNRISRSAIQTGKNLARRRWAAIELDKSFPGSIFLQLQTQTMRAYVLWLSSNCICTGLWLQSAGPGALPWVDRSSLIPSVPDTYNRRWRCKIRHLVLQVEWMIEEADKQMPETGRRGGHEIPTGTDKVINAAPHNFPSLLCSTSS